MNRGSKEPSGRRAVPRSKTGIVLGTMPGDYARCGPGRAPGLRFVSPEHLESGQPEEDLKALGAPRPVALNGPGAGAAGL
jgi:hypothetical protein